MICDDYFVGNLSLSPLILVILFDIFMSCQEVKLVLKSCLWGNYSLLDTLVYQDSKKGQSVCGQQHGIIIEVIILLGGM